MTWQSAQLSNKETIMKNIKLQLALIIFGVLSVVSITNAATITTFVDGRSGPWNSAVNPSFNWGASVLNPTVIDSSTGLSMSSGDTLSLIFTWGTTDSGGMFHIISGPNGYEPYGDFAGISGLPSFFIKPSQDPVYYMALLGAFTDSNDVIVGTPFKIGFAFPLNAVMPNGASKLSMGFNGSNGSFEYNSGGVTLSITETSSVPVPTAVWLFGSGLIGLLGSRKTKLSARL